MCLVFLRTHLTQWQSKFPRVPQPLNVAWSRVTWREKTSGITLYCMALARRKRKITSKVVCHCVCSTRFVWSIDRWFVRSFVRSLVCSLVRSFVYSFTRPLVRSQLRLFSRLFISSSTLSCIFNIIWLRFFLCRTDFLMIFPKGTTTDLIDGIPNQEHRSHAGSEKTSHPLAKFKKNSTPVAEDRLDDVSFVLWCLYNIFYATFYLQTMSLWGNKFEKKQL